MILYRKRTNLHSWERNENLPFELQKTQPGDIRERCLEIPAAISEGETLEELTANMKETIQIVLEHIKDKAKKEKSKIIEITI